MKHTDTMKHTDPRKHQPATPAPHLPSGRPHAPVSLIAAAALLLAAASAPAAYTVTWNTNPPGNDNWFYFVPGGGATGDGDVDTDWQASGGWNGSGYVRTHLGSLGEWEHTPGVRYPLYTYADHHPINFIQTPLVSLAIRDLSGLGGANLRGGSLRLWIGNFTDPDGPGGNPPELSFYYFNLQSLAVASTWDTGSLLVNQNPASWTPFGPPPAMAVTELFNNPQQWGIGVFGGTAAPSGTLGFDQLSVQVPEPSVASLLGLAAITLTRRRRADRARR